MKVIQRHMNYPIEFIPETISDGIKIGFMIEKLKEEKKSFSLILNNNVTKDIEGIKINPDTLVELLT